MNTYKSAIVFFAELGNAKAKDEAIEKLDKIPEVVDCDVYDDDEDWNIECVLFVKSDSRKGAEKKIEKLMSNINLTWDYHYAQKVWQI